MSEEDLRISGWNTLEHLGLQSAEVLQQRDREREDVVALFATVFANEAGRKVLAYLKEGTTDKSPIADQVFAQGTLTADQLMPYVLVRAGQNSVIETICRMLAEAEAGPPKTKKRRGT